MNLWLLIPTFIIGSADRRRDLSSDRDRAR